MLRTIKKPLSKSEDYSLSDTTEIVSPTPERSVLSSNNLHRFSKILGVDDKSFSRSILYRDSVSLEDESRSDIVRKASSDQNVSLENLTAHTFTPEDSDSDGAPHLSPSFMQTFGGLARSSSYLSTPQSKDPILATALGPTYPPTMRVNSSISNGQYTQQNGRSLSNVQHSIVAIPPPATDNRSTDDQTPHSIVAISPPTTDNRSTDDRPPLPFAFMPLIPDIEKSAVGPPQTDIAPLLALEHRKASEKGSITSSRSSRPWNRDSNYPWDDQSLSLDVILPQEPGRTPSPVGRFPRFKLRIHRASTSSAGTGILTKSRTSSDGAVSSRRDSNHVRSQGPIFKLKVRQRLAAGPGQENSSHAVG